MTYYERVAHVSKTLTEQWKKGELESGFYYVYLKYLEMFDIAGSSTLSGILERGNENSIEVLAPVPSYEEWQEKQKSLKVLAETYCKEKEENQKLKELLNECKHMIIAYSINHDTFAKEKVIDTVKQIDNAIGEKK